MRLIIFLFLGSVLASGKERGKMAVMGQVMAARMRQAEVPVEHFYAI